MNQGKGVIAICNTSVKRKYYQSYLEMAQHHGYTVQIIACEAVIGSDGAIAQNIHAVPNAILKRQRQNWEFH